MRSVNVDRKTRGSSRAKSVRPSTRGKRELADVQPGVSRREQAPGLMARLGAGLAERLSLRRPIILLCGALTLLVLIGALLASGVIGRGVRAVNEATAAALSHAGFGISEIHITGNRRTPYKQILQVLAMQPGQSIFSADLPGARQRLAALDWIASAEVHRRYPDAIFVTLVEKRPFALWQMPVGANGEAPIAVVERSGAVITTREVEKFRRLPKLVGAGAPQSAADLVDAVQSHRAVSARIIAYARVSSRRWNLILDDGVVVKLPESDWLPQIDALERLIIDRGILERDVTEIDLRSPSHYFFLLKSGEKKDVERGKET
ncbi:MAG TPA: FtsQ-type POTRA domain-containing protein [Rhizomicrobium sp.]|nr:FtsQ-type POTRA domain-containing protein [Rhizomicrobium sp.]